MNINQLPFINKKKCRNGRSGMVTGIRIKRASKKWKCAMVLGGIEAAQGGFARGGLPARERETNVATFDASPHPLGTE